ncbi:MAG TPA: hypothetical protein VKY90_10095 [Candidatus Dormibacteraeota bacterium]|nr:hypothetical protein [Candidatus Dormibacteraeota bacterium]
MTKGDVVVPSPLEGTSLPSATRLLLAIGVLGALLFTTVYLLEGATRPGHDAWADAVSLLSLGPGDGCSGRTSFSSGS